MTRSLRLTAALAALTSLVLGTAAASADCQMAGPLEEELSTAEVAFVGTVTEVVGSMAFIEVDEVWAGPVGRTVEVHGLTSGVEFSEDDRHWEQGTTYLVVPYVEANVLRDSICSATVEWNEGLADLRPADAVVHGEEAASPSSLPVVPLAVAAVVLATVAISFLAFRRRGGESG
jgi:hypothetical protein